VIVVRGALLVADEQVEPAVVVEVRPRRRLGGVLVEEPRGLRDVLEAALSEVAQQRVGVASGLAEPPAAHDVQIQVAVVVVVGVVEVQAAGQSGQPRRVCAVGERPVALVAQEADRIVQPPRRRDEVDEAVAVEVVHRASAGEPGDGHAGRGGDVPEPGRGRLAGSRRGDAPPFRDSLGGRSQRHDREVQQPSSLERIGLELQPASERLPRAPRSRGIAMHRGALDGIQAGLRRMMLETVGLLADAQGGDADEPLQRGLDGGFLFGRERGGGDVDGLEFPERFLRAAVEQQLLGQLDSKPQRASRIGRFRELPAEPGNAVGAIHRPRVRRLAGHLGRRLQSQHGESFGHASGAVGDRGSGRRRFRRLAGDGDQREADQRRRP
jgi:hypothetical protein